ncbi:MAG: prepilin peptidase [Hyphomicrobiales bacterium]|nr:prepilin peptidase [Hyphomicrobiales bacterium]MDE2114384.1 prepilin peptidase [Hyphomicrobiales bacterium]
MLHTLLLSLFPAMMVFAAVSDLFTMTISNRLSILLVAAFLVSALYLGMPLTQIGWQISCGIGILVLTFTLFSFGWIGGGDAKLAAATALWVGWAHVMDYGLIASLLGGVLTSFLILARKFPLPGFLLQYPWATRLHDPKTGVPYGIALAAAGIIVYPHIALAVATFA